MCIKWIALSDFNIILYSFHSIIVAILPFPPTYTSASTVYRLRRHNLCNGYRRSLPHIPHICALPDAELQYLSLYVFSRQGEQRKLNVKTGKSLFNFPLDVIAWDHNCATIITLYVFGYEDIVTFDFTCEVWYSLAFMAQWTKCESKRLETDFGIKCGSVSNCSFI